MPIPPIGLRFHFLYLFFDVSGALKKTPERGVLSGKILATSHQSVFSQQVRREDRSVLNVFPFFKPPKIIASHCK